MNRSTRCKFAFTLLGTSAFGANSLAMDPAIQNSSKIATVSCEKVAKENIDARNRILTKFREACNDDNTWEKFKTDYCEMLDYICHNVDDVKTWSIDKKSLEFFISVCKGENAEFNVQKLDNKNGFEIKSNRDNLSVKISINRININKQTVVWKLSSNKCAKKFEASKGIKLSDRVINQIKGEIHQIALYDKMSKGINEEDEYNSLLLFLHSIVASEVINSQEYEDLKYLFISDCTDFFGLGIDISRETGEHGYRLIFKKNNDYIAYLLYEDENTGYVRRLKFTKGKWEKYDDSPDKEFELISSKNGIKKSKNNENEDDKNLEKQKISEKENEKENEKTARDQILEKFRQAWNDDNTWENFKVKFSKMMDHVCNNENVVKNYVVKDYKIGQQAISSFISFCKNEITEFNVEKIKKNCVAGFVIKSNDNKFLFKINLKQVDNNQKVSEWKVSDGIRCKKFGVKFG